MSITKINYTKDWQNPSDFPTVETSEAVVRSDMQELYTQIKNGVNNIVDELEGTSGAENTGITPITGVTGTNVQDALEDLKDQIDAKASTSSLSAHTSNTSNPHSVTKSQVGLGNVDNTADVDKTVKEAGKVTNSLTFGNKTFDGSATKEIVKGDIGLGNVDNTADIDKTVKEAGKVTNSLTFGLKTYNGSAAREILKSDIGLGNVDNTADIDKTVKEAGKVTNSLTFGTKTFDGSAAKEIVKGDIGLGNVDNTSDANKPISTATATALATKESISDANNLIQSVTFTEGTGTFVFTKQGGGTITIDTNLEKVPGSMALVEDPVGSGTYYLVIYDRSTPPQELSRCPVTALFNAIDVEDTATINLVLSTSTAGKKKLTANVIDGSVTFAKLASAVQDRITALETAAINSVSDTSTIDLDITNHVLSASVKDGSIGNAKLDSTLAGRITTLESEAIATVTDGSTIDFTLSDHDLTAEVKDGSISNTKLDSTLAGRITTLESEAIATVTDGTTIDFTLANHNLTAEVKDGVISNAKLDSTLAGRITTLESEAIATVTDSNTIDLTFNSTTHDLTADVKDASITNAKLASEVMSTIAGYAQSASTSATNAAASESNASDYATAASGYATTASGHADTASGYATAASGSATTAGNKATEASGYATNASGSANLANGYATTANSKAVLSESWAVGGTGTRTGEDTNNAKYWCEQAGQIAGGVFVTAVNGVTPGAASGPIVIDADDIGSTGTTNQFVTSTEKSTWNAKQDALPTVTNDRFLHTNSSTGALEWSEVDALPTQTGQSGKFLTTDGSSASWAEVDIPTTLAELTDDSTHRLVTDTEKSTWNAKQDAIPANTYDAYGSAATVQGNLNTHTGDSTIHVTSADKTAWNAKYDKPSSGIPDSDIASASTWNAKQDALPSVTNDRYLHTNSSTGALEWSEVQMPAKYTGTITGDGTTTDFVVTHNLGTKNINAVIYDSNDDQILTDVEATSTTTATISFGSAVASGTVYSILILT